MDTNVRALVRMDYTKIILCRIVSCGWYLPVGAVVCDTVFTGQKRSIASQPAAMAFALESTVLSLKNSPASA